MLDLFIVIERIANWVINIAAPIVKTYWDKFKNAAMSILNVANQVIEGVKTFIKKELYFYEKIMRSYYKTMHGIWKEKTVIQEVKPQDVPKEYQSLVVRKQGEEVDLTKELDLILQ